MFHKDEQSPLADWPLTKVILIVEDADAGGVPLSHTLSQVTHHRVFVASDGRAALKFCRYVRPDVFVLHCPPGEDIIGLSHQLHTPVETLATPTIVVGTLDLKQFERFADEVVSYRLILMGEPLQVNYLLNAIGELLL